jgi:putative spermidine/putrescine transport system substrate-binding protein
MKSVSRRHFLRTAGSAGLLAGLSSFTTVSAQENTITVTALGGRWENSIREHFIPLFQQRTGAKVNVVLGGPAQWMSQIESQSGKTPIDAIDNSETLAFRLIDSNKTVKLTTQEVPNIANIPDVFHKPWDDHAAMYMYAGAGFFYNKAKIKQPPKSWQEFFERTAKGEFGKAVALPSIQYGWTPAFVWTYAKVFGGGIQNMEPGFKAIRSVKPFVAKFWSTAGEIERMISAGEVDIGVFWDGRVYSLMDAGASNLAFQRMDSHILISGVASQVIKGGNEKLALEYVNTLLDPKPQLEYFKMINYAVTNTKVEYPPQAKDRILPASQGVVAPYRELGKMAPALIERWNEEIRT